MTDCHEPSVLRYPRLANITPFETGIAVGEELEQTVCAIP